MKPHARPRSEGGRAALPPPASASHDGAAPSAMRRSYTSLDAPASVSERRCPELGDRGPRRPRTTPKPRVQRVLLGPSHDALLEQAARNSSPMRRERSACFMTHLPDSPPKPKATASPRSAIALERCVQPPERSSSSRSSLRTDCPDGNSATRQSSAPNEPIEALTARSVAKDDGDLRAQADMTEETTELGDAVEEDAEQQSQLEDDQEVSTMATSSSDLKENAVSDPLLSTEGEELLNEDEYVVEASSGPLLADIDHTSTTEKSVEAGPEVDTVLHCFIRPDSPMLSHVAMNDADADSDADSGSEELDTAAACAEDEYAASLETRKRVMADASDRMRLRSELEGYLESLKTLRGEDGESVVEFPRNYNQILALMTEQDLRVEGVVGSSTAENKSSSPRSVKHNWARVLIRTGLSRQQAFGPLADEDGDAASENGLAAKIALKMAQIRQLDAVLEDKLGKDLYKAAPPVRSSKKPERNQEPDGPVAKARGPTRAIESSSRATASAASSLDTSEPTRAKRKVLHFVKRNKEVAANGMRANMTRAEEARLVRLLEGVDALRDDRKPGASDGASAATDQAPAPNEFAMDAAEKAAIAQLLASQPDTRGQSILAELEDAALLEDIPEEGAGASLRPENRRLRLRLHRVNQELRLLEQMPDIAIVSDDEPLAGGDQGEDDASEADSDCRSERSFRSATSAGASTTSSMCSTRSGVISRREFRQFVAEQQAVFHRAPTASSDDIRRLLSSISRLATPSAAALTPPVS